MMSETLSSVVHETFLETYPRASIPCATDLMNAFLTPNTVWKINFYKCVRNDDNSYNSGVLCIGDTVLVQTGTPDNFNYHCVQLSHVCVFA